MHHYGSNKSRNFGSYTNHLKSIAIGPGSLISHFGIIKTTKYPNKTLTNEEKKTKQLARGPPSYGEQQTSNNELGTDK